MQIDNNHRWRTNLSVLRHRAPMSSTTTSTTRVMPCQLSNCSWSESGTSLNLSTLSKFLLFPALRLLGYLNISNYWYDQPSSTQQVVGKEVGNKGRTGGGGEIQEMQTRHQNIPQDYRVFMCQLADTTNSCDIDTHTMWGWLNGCLHRVEGELAQVRRLEGITK